MRHFFLLLTLVVIPYLSMAQQTKTVTASYTYYAPTNVSLDEAKHTALERAKIQCIADNFGSVVSQSNSTIIENNNGISQTKILSLGGSDVKGEWVETTGEPIYNINYEQDMLIVTVTVKGKIRKSTQKQYDLNVRVLRYGLDDKNEDSSFKNGDDIFLSFESPVNGYLTIYLLEEEDTNVYCLLPYKNASMTSYPIEGNKKYVFFSSTFDKNGNVDEYTMTAAAGKEFNDIILCFSTNDFTKAVGINASAWTPRKLTYNDFVKWLTKKRKEDEAFSVIKKSITISKE